MSDDVKVVMCTTTAWVSESQMVTEGKLYRADDPIVIDNPGAFSDDLNSYIKPKPFVDDDEPRRGPGRPRRDSN
jgi:hypothetical protein